MYDDPKTIPFDIIANRIGVEPNRIRALLRSVNDPKIYLGLVDVGVDSQDIPPWYARPKFIKKIRKSQARISEEQKVQSPDRTSVVTHPLQEFLFWYPIFQQIRARGRREFREAMAIFRETVDDIIKVRHEIRPTRVRVKAIPFAPPKNAGLHQELREFIKSLDEERPSVLIELVKLGKDNQERSRAAKLARYGDLIRPVEIIWPPGFKPLKLLSGPRGEEIQKRLNLDHLR